jgi:hypothetical protein
LGSLHVVWVQCMYGMAKWAALWHGLCICCRK